MTNDELILHLVEKNDYKYNLLKAAEELQELSLILTQMALKEEKVSKQAVIDEIGDVKIRLKVLEFFFDKSRVKERIEFKMNKLKSFVRDNKYIGKL